MARPEWVSSDGGSRPPRIAYLPNERVEGDQIGPRVALQSLVDDKTVNAVLVLSLVPLGQQLGGRKLALRQLHRELAAFAPTAVLVSHPAGSGIDGGDLRAIRGLPSRPVIGYLEMDPYARVRHDLPPEARACADNADIVWTCGTGSFQRLMREQGSREIRYSGHRKDESRFPALTDPAASRSFAIVSIANRNRPRLPWHRLPGARQRERLMIALSRKYGQRFGLFGRGWEELASNQGPCAYNQQPEILRRGLISVNWDHFPREPQYFSDRLPISLSAGIPHITTWHPGFGSVFPDAAAHGLFLEDSISSVMRRVHILLERPTAELEAMGRRAALLSESFGQLAEMRRVFMELAAVWAVP